jgi:hypothetical protein
MGNKMVCAPQRVDTQERLKRTDQQVGAYKSMLYYEESCDYLYFVRQDSKVDKKKTEAKYEMSPVLESIEYLTECLE